MSRKQRADERTREPLTPAPATSLLAHILARPGASGNCACLGSFDDLAVSLCPLCTSVYQPGCGRGCSTCGVVDSCWGSGFRRRPGDDRGGRSSGSGAFPIAHIDPVPQEMWESLTRRGDAPRSEPLVALRRRSMQRILYMEFREFPTSTH